MLPHLNRNHIKSPKLSDPSQRSRCKKYCLYFEWKLRQHNVMKVDQWQNRKLDVVHSAKLQSVQFIAISWYDKPRAATWSTLDAARMSSASGGATSSSAKRPRPSGSTRGPRTSHRPRTRSSPILRTHETKTCSTRGSAATWRQLQLPGRLRIPVPLFFQEDRALKVDLQRVQQRRRDLQSEFRQLITKK